MTNYDNMVYLRDKKFIFTVVPKAACTNWKCILRNLLGYDDYLDVSLAHDRVRGGLTYLNTIDKAEEILNDKSIAKYCFVRNPYSRILSAYLNKIEPYITGIRDKNQGNTYFYLIYESVTNFVENNFNTEDVDFRSFLKWLKYSNSSFVNNEHWLSQSKILNIDKIEYDFIGRMENIEQDTTTLLSLMQSKLSFPKKDIAGHATNANEKFLKYYCDESISLVNEIYKEDFEFLNYPMMDK